MCTHGCFTLHVPNTTFRPKTRVLQSIVLALLQLSFFLTRVKLNSWASFSRQLPSATASDLEAGALVSLAFEHLASKPLRRLSRGPLASHFSARGQKAATAAVGRGWARLLRPIQAWNRYGDVSAEEMGRAAGKFEKVEEQLWELEAAAMRQGADCSEKQKGAQLRYGERCRSLSAFLFRLRLPLIPPASSTISSAASTFSLTLSP